MFVLGIRVPDVSSLSLKYRQSLDPYRHGFWNWMSQGVHFVARTEKSSLSTTEDSLLKLKWETLETPSGESVIDSDVVDFGEEDEGDDIVILWK